MARYYLDTSIWLDYYEKRGNNGALAAQLIIKLIKENCIIGISDLTVKELKGLGYGNNEIGLILRPVTAKNSRRIHISFEQLEEAENISHSRNVPRKDALHAILCRDNDLLLIATDKHFESLKDVANFKRPEEVI